MDFLEGKTERNHKANGYYHYVLFILPDDIFDMMLSLEWKIYKYVLHLAAWPR